MNYESSDEDCFAIMDFAWECCLWHVIDLCKGIDNNVLVKFILKL